MYEFDFELWARLALEEPDIFESLRKQYIEYEISKADSSKKSRLSGLQFQIDMKRARARTALGGCIKVSEMMMNHFYYKFKPSLDTLSCNEKKSREDTIKSNCDVIPLFKNEKE